MNSNFKNIIVILIIKKKLENNCYYKLILKLYCGLIAKWYVGVALNGTSVIRRHNSTLVVDGKTYETIEISSNKLPLPAILQHKSIANGTQSLIPSNDKRNQ